MSVAGVGERGAVFVLEGDARCSCNIVEATECSSCVLDGLGYGLFVCDVDGVDVQSTDMTSRLGLPLINE